MLPLHLDLNSACAFKDSHMLSGYIHAEGLAFQCCSSLCSSNAYTFSVFSVL